MTAAENLEQHVGNTPKLEAPALAQVRRLVMTRPPWFSDRPLAVDEDLWHAASAEMAEVMRQRGFSLPRANLSEDNFLLHGTAIVRER